MTKKEFKKLKRGDVVRNIGSERVYVVTGNYGEYSTFTDTIIAYNHTEWEIMEKETINGQTPINTY
jgi:hypothetical protein